MKIKITSDSTCDLSKELLARYDIDVIPLAVIKSGQVYQDGVNIQPADIFRHVEQGGALCSTSAVNVEDYRKYFAKFANDYDAVIHINLGSGFSTCCQNAAIAASEFSNVHIVDSMSLSTGQGQLVIEAALLAKDGLSPVEICSRLNEIRGRVNISFILDRLEYMQKGGRCSSVVALGGKLLKIKPCIAVKEGSLKMVDKYRGNFEKCIEKYIRDFLKERKENRAGRIFITYTDVPPEVLQAARDAVAKYGNFDEVLETQAGCTVSCHCGPGTLGIIFID